MASDYLSLQRARHKRLFKALSRQPLQSVVGIISPSGCVKHQMQGLPWQLDFRMTSWRLNGGSVDSGKLEITRIILPSAEYPSLVPYRIIRIRARVLHDFENDGPHALLDRIVAGVTTDAELNAIREAALVPVVCRDKTLGRLTLDRCVNQFVARPTWLNKRVDLTLQAESPETLAQPLSTAYALWKQAVKWRSRVETFAADRLLDLKNKSWLGEDEKPMTSKQFIRCLKLDTINIGRDGNFSLWFEDRGLFWGHTVEVRCNIKKGPLAVDIIG